MGLFDFVKEAGRKLGIGSDAPTPDELRAEVTKLGLDAKDLAVDVQGDTVKVSGNAPSQAPRGGATRSLDSRSNDPAG